MKPGPRRRLSSSTGRMPKPCSPRSSLCFERTRSVEAPESRSAGVDLAPLSANCGCHPRELSGRKFRRRETTRRRIPLWLSAVAVLLSSPLQAQTLLPAEGNFVETLSQLTFPVQARGWNRSRIIRYPEPGGHSVSYELKSGETRQAVATAYVYPHVPSWPATLREHFLKTLNELRSMSPAAEVVMQRLVPADSAGSGHDTWSGPCCSAPDMGIQADGTEVWRFLTVPRQGEPGRETWQGKDVDTVARRPGSRAAMTRRSACFTGPSAIPASNATATIGLDGIAATVRNGGTQPGQVKPESVEEERVVRTGGQTRRQVAVRPATSRDA